MALNTQMGTLMSSLWQPEILGLVLWIRCVKCRGYGSAVVRIQGLEYRDYGLRVNNGGLEISRFGGSTLDAEEWLTADAVMV